MRLAFRTDASTAIGTGHVARCLALAEAARNAGDEALFICRAHDGNMVEHIEAQGFAVAVLPLTSGTDDDLMHSHWLGARQDVDAAATIEALSNFRPDWLIADHYGLDVHWERAVTPHARHVMAIDDLADRPHHCALLLDQNFFIHPATRYAGLLTAHCRTLLGPRYALLRPAFAAARKTLRSRNNNVRRVLIFFGGVDAAGHSARTLDALSRLERDDIAVDLVIGALNSDRAALLARSKASPHITPHTGGADMAGLMASADLAIGAGGVTQWERTCLGLPSVLLAIAGNQRPIVADLARAGYCWGLSDGANATAADIAALLHAALISHEARQAMAERLMALCDGQGARRVLAAMRGAGLALRPVQQRDGDMLFRWRNDPVTRRHALNPAPLAYAGHLAWLDRALADDKTCLLTGVLEDKPIGALRFDLNDDMALLSIYLDPACHGRGLGGALLRAGILWLTAHHPAIHHIEADVLEANQASRALFEDAGFEMRQRRHRLTLKETQP